MIEGSGIAANVGDTFWADSIMYRVLSPGRAMVVMVDRPSSQGPGPAEVECDASSYLVVEPSRFELDGITYEERGVGQVAVAWLDGEYFFDGGIEELAIPAEITYERASYSVVALGDYCFHARDSFNDVVVVVIPDSVTRIGERAFSGCDHLASVRFGNAVTHIGGAAFEGCSNLARIALPDTLATIEWGTFLYCSGLAAVTIGTGVTAIESEAFCECKKLRSVHIPDQVASIAEDAFPAKTRLVRSPAPKGPLADSSGHLGRLER